VAQNVAADCLRDVFTEFRPVALYPGPVLVAVKPIVGDALPAETVVDGVEAALDRAKKEQAPLICLGSLYLYKDVLLSNFS